MGRVCDGLARGLARPARIPALTPPGHLVLAPTDEVRTLSGNCETWILRFSLAAATGGGSSLGLAKPVRLCRRYWRDSPVAMSRRYARGRGPPAAQVPQRHRGPPAGMLAN
jgi:hypothetical protein